MRLSVMKNIKKHAAGIIALTILVSMLIPAGSVNSANSDVDFINPPDAPGFSYAVNSLNALPFSDVRSDDWFIEDLKYILNYGKGIFSGYPDGTFRPADTLTTDMYIKLIVTAMGHSVENGKEYWASTYIKKAIDEGYVVPDEDIRHTPEMLEDQYYAYKQPINRGEMAMFLNHKREYKSLISFLYDNGMVSYSSLEKLLIPVNVPVINKWLECLPELENAFINHIEKIELSIDETMAKTNWQKYLSHVMERAVISTGVFYRGYLSELWQEEEGYKLYITPRYVNTLKQDQILFSMLDDITRIVIKPGITDYLRIQSL
jgi:hypothetical protein